MIDAPAQAILLEPVGRNTAPAIALAALAAQQRDGQSDPLLLVLPADHVIRDVAGIPGCRAQGACRAARGRATGHLRRRARRRRKPATATSGVARRWVPMQQVCIRNRRHSSKSPMPRAPRSSCKRRLPVEQRHVPVPRLRYLAELERHAPDIASRLSRGLRLARAMTSTSRASDEQAFAACRSDSIDYAVMEKTDAAAVVPLDAGWSDVGSWSSLHAALDSDAPQATSRTATWCSRTAPDRYVHAEQPPGGGRGPEGPRGGRDQGCRAGRAAWTRCRTSRRW